MPSPLLIARTPATEITLLPAMSNRHGLITGATGTGKTVSLQVMAERFSAIGVPVFMADVKGDLAGISQSGACHQAAAAADADRADAGIQRLPTVFGDAFGERIPAVRRFPT
jgi:DNA helicase HerA-like ATPase